jgi:CHAT domain
VIDLCLSPGQVTVGEPTDLRLRATNRGTGPCTNISFTIGVPSGIIHIQGRNNMCVERLEAGESACLGLRVLAEHPGRFAVMTTNLSYRDHRGQVRRVPDVDVELVALSRREPRLPRLSVEVQTNNLPLGEWSDLKVKVANSGTVDVTDLVVSISGSVTPDSRSRIRRIGALAPGAPEDVCFSVRADEAGTAVPVHFDLRFSGPAGPIQISTTATIGVARGRRPRQEAEQARKLTILLLTANPLDTRRLQLDKEVRQIEQAIRQGRDRDSVQVRVCPAARVEDLVQWLLEIRPEFLHLSGHGADGTFVAEDDHGLDTTLSPDALGLLLKTTARDIRCVTVNACNTERLAQELAKHVPHVIAMRRQVLDSVAIQFSIAFYAAIVAGHSVEEAFSVGQAAMGLTNARDLDTAILLPEPKPPAAGRKTITEMWSIRSDAGVRNSLLVQFLREEGVQVEQEAPGEYRGIEWANDAQQVAAMLIATGTAAAVKAAVERFRQRYKHAHVTVEPQGTNDVEGSAPHSARRPAAPDPSDKPTGHDRPEEAD